MPDNTSGGHSLPASYFVQDGDTVMPVQHNDPFEDVSTGLTNRLHRDGRTLWTGAQKANGYKLTGLADGTDLQDAATYKQAVSASTPIGSIVEYAGSTAPTNWLLCYGQAISRTTYATLFGIIGTTYGAGDGSTTFNLPDKRGRVSVGKDNMGGTSANRVTSAISSVDGAALGGSGGGATVFLSEANIPAHTHSGTTSTAGAHAHAGTTLSAGGHTHIGDTDLAGGHSHTGNTSYAGDHSHSYQRPAYIGLYGRVGLNFVVFQSGGDTTSTAGGHSHDITTNYFANHNHSFTTASSGAHTHDFATDIRADHQHSFTTSSVGSGQAHGNMQPSIVFNTIIRVL